MATTTLRRIQADLREISTDPSPNYHAHPLEDNMFEWHFTIRGPPATEFEGGLYHGRILLPTEYPFKPPNIVFLTENGRWETHKKICLSISAHHPESWSPAWGLRLMLEALISFMPSKGEGALAAIDLKPDERKMLAQRSLAFVCPHCGSVKDLMEKHAQKAAEKAAAAVSAGSEAAGGGGARSNKYAAEIAKMHMVPAKESTTVATPLPDSKPAAAGFVAKPSIATTDNDALAERTSSESDSSSSSESEDGSARKSAAAPVNATSAVESARRRLAFNEPQPQTGNYDPGLIASGVPAAPAAAAAVAPAVVVPPAQPLAQQPVAAAAVPKPRGDAFLTFLSWVLTALIALLLYRRLMGLADVGELTDDASAAVGGKVDSLLEAVEAPLP